MKELIEVATCAFALGFGAHYLLFRLRHATGLYFSGYQDGARWARDLERRSRLQ